jgi:hypothetical protein
MKTTVPCFILVAGLLFGSLLASAQSINPYQKGNFHFTLNQRMDFKFLSHKVEGEKQYSIYDSYVDLWTAYFLTDHFALDVGFHHSKYVEKNDTKNIDASNMIFLGGLYGGQIQNFNLQAYTGIGLGASRYQYSEDYTEKDMDLLYLLEVESPINISGSCQGYLTPGIGFAYSRSSWKGEEGNEMYNPGGSDKDTYFFFDVDLTFFMPRTDFNCDIRDGCTQSSGKYQKGTNLIGVESFLHFDIGNYKVDYDETEGSYYTDYEETYNCFDFDALWYYYVLKNFAVGLDLDVDFDHYKDKEGDFTYRSSEFIFIPSLMYNLPLDGCLNNLFANGGFGFGFDKSNYSNGYESKTTNNILAWYLGAGYNYFFGKHLALTPKLTFESDTYKPKDSESNGERGVLSEHKYTESGFVLSFGLSYFFNQKEEVRYMP